MEYKYWLNEWLDNYIEPTAKTKTFIRYSEIVNQHLIPKLGKYLLIRLAITGSCIEQKKRYKPLYSVLCEIECEYDTSVLKKNKEDGLFKQIASYFTTTEMSAKDLFVECFS